MDEKEIKPVDEVEEEFADAPKATEEPAKEEPEIEEAPAEEPQEVDAKGEPVNKKEEPVSYTYDDPRLANIEAARADFLKRYKNMSRWSWIPTLLLIAAIILAWIIPTYVWPDNATLSLGISLGVVAVVIVAMLVLSYFKRKKTNEAMKDYFGKFYMYTNDYVFHGTGVTNIEGDIDSKITKEEFEECGLYEDLYSVGSRASLTFRYNGRKCGIVDAAAQVKGQKAARTVFVGKYFRAPNNYRGEALCVYLKGNDRALPPTAVNGWDVLYEDNTMIVRGHALAKKAFTKKIKDAVKAIRTDDTLVDFTLLLEEGKTFVLLGYEDNLMVLPMEKPFNPAPTEHYKNDMKLVFELVDAIEGVKGEKRPTPVNEEVAEEPSPAIEPKEEEKAE